MNTLCDPVRSVRSAPSLLTRNRPSARNPGGCVLSTGQQRSRFMQTRIGYAFAAVLVSRGARTSPQPAPAARSVRAAEPGSSTLDDQVDLAVTVYNSDIALVRDVRDLQLPRGGFDLRFMD